MDHTVGARGLRSCIAVSYTHLKVFAQQQGDLYEGHDYAALSQAADFVLLMTYEWGYTYGPPMAVAPIRNVRQVVDYALTEMAPEKIYLGIPNYGYDWTLPFRQGSRARSISNPEAVTIAADHYAAIRFDEAAQSPWFRYVDDSGREHEVWFEDARSIRAKLDLAQMCIRDSLFTAPPAFSFISRGRRPPASTI